MGDLEHELRALRYQALVQKPSPSPATTGDSDANSATTTLAKGAYTKHFLRNALQSQQFALAGLQALVSSYSVRYLSQPVTIVQQHKAQVTHKITSGNLLT